MDSALGIDRVPLLGNTNLPPTAQRRPCLCPPCPNVDPAPPQLFNSLPITIPLEVIIALLLVILDVTDNEDIVPQGGPFRWFSTVGFLLMYVPSTLFFLILITSVLKSRCPADQVQRNSHKDHISLYTSSLSMFFGMCLLLYDILLFFRSKNYTWKYSHRVSAFCQLLGTVLFVFLNKYIPRKTVGDILMLSHICASIIFRLTWNTIFELIQIYQHTHHPEQHNGLIPDWIHQMFLHSGLFCVAFFEFHMVALVITLSILYEAATTKSDQDESVRIDPPIEDLTKNPPVDIEKKNIPVCQPSTSTASSSQMEGTTSRGESGSGTISNSPEKVERREHPQSNLSSAASENQENRKMFNWFKKNWIEMLAVIIISIGLGAIAVVFRVKGKTNAEEKGHMTFLAWAYYCFVTLIAIAGIVPSFFLSCMRKQPDGHAQTKETEFNISHHLDQLFFYFGYALMFLYGFASFYNSIRNLAFEATSFVILDLVITLFSLWQAVAQAYILVTQKLYGPWGLWMALVLAVVNMAMFILDLWDAGELGTNGVPSGKEEKNFAWLQFLRSLCSFCFFFRFHSTCMFMDVAEHCAEGSHGTEGHVNPLPDVEGNADLRELGRLRPVV